MQINPNYGVNRYSNGHESTVSIRDLADHAQITDPNVVENTLLLSPNVETELQTPLPWRSSRARKAPDQLQYH